MDGWKVSVLLFSVIVDEGWNGKCSQNEMSLYPLPTKLYVGRGYTCSWRTLIKQRTDVGFVEADEDRGRREDRVHLGGNDGQAYESEIRR